MRINAWAGDRFFVSPVNSPNTNSTKGAGEVAFAKFCRQYRAREEAIARTVLNDLHSAESHNSLLREEYSTSAPRTYWASPQRVAIDSGVPWQAKYF